MSRRSKLAIALAVIGTILVMIGCIKARRGVLTVRKMRTDIAVSKVDESNPGFPTTDSSAPVGGQGSTIEEKIETKEFMTMHKMIDLMKAQVEASSSQALVAELQTLGLEPRPTFTNSDSAGRITVVSTQESVDPNTRYFWAQFRGSNDGAEEFMQIMTFEFRPGPTAMDEAQAMVKKIFALERAPDYSSAVAVSWDINEFYEVLINTINEAHLKNGVMDRQYTTEDLGVIQVTVQVKVDDGHDH